MLLQKGSIVEAIQIFYTGTKLLAAQITELKKYVFLVAESANKTEIKKAVSEIFGVKVEKVTTIRMDGKLKRQGRYPAGRTASYKKAVVKLTADSKTIEFFEGMV